MFIFTAFFRLLFLPFVLVGMLFGLLGISTRIFLIPLKIFARHTVACVVIAGVVILYFALKNDPLNELKPAPAESRTRKGAAPIVEPVQKYENGDSAFSADLYQNMTEIERGQYSKTFYSVMSTIPDGREHIWNYYNIHGTLKPTRTFTSKTGTVCRHFTEVLKVHKIQQTMSGMACDNGGGSWCKLKPNATPACGLGYNPGFVEGIGDSIKRLF
jgi:surface antigen